jgi:hypothetical protein
MSQYIQENETQWDKCLGIGADGAKAVMEKGNGLESRYVNLLVIQDGLVASYIRRHPSTKKEYLQILQLR